MGIAVALLTAQESWDVVEKTGELGFCLVLLLVGLGGKIMGRLNQSRIDKSECHDKFLMKNN